MNSTVIVAGILAGGLYGLIALGLSLGFGVMKLVNLAHGELVVGGAYVGYYLVGLTSVDALIVLPIVMVVLAAVGFLLQRFLLTDLLRSSPTAPLVGTFGLSLLGQALFRVAYGSDPRSISAPFAASGFSLFGARVQTAYLVAFAVALLLTAAVHVGLSRTRAGSAVRAASADPDIAELLGIDVRRVYAVTFAVAAALAAAGGIMAGVTQSFTPVSGISYLLVGFAVVALGGIGSVGGTLAGGILLGVIQSVAVEVLGGGYRDVAVYVTFVLVLAIRPSGLFNRRTALA